MIDDLLKEISLDLGGWCWLLEGDSKSATARMWAEGHTPVYVSLGCSGDDMPARALSRAISCAKEQIANCAEPPPHLSISCLTSGGSAASCYLGCGC